MSEPIEPIPRSVPRPGGWSPTCCPSAPRRGVSASMRCWALAFCTRVTSPIAVLQTLADVLTPAVRSCWRPTARTCPGHPGDRGSPAERCVPARPLPLLGLPAEALRRLGRIVGSATSRSTTTPRSTAIRESSQQNAGVGQARNRFPRAVQRTVPFGLIMTSIAICWYATAGHQPQPSKPREPKPLVPRQGPTLHRRHARQTASRHHRHSTFAVVRRCPPCQSQDVDFLGVARGRCREIEWFSVAFRSWCCANRLSGAMGVCRSGEWRRTGVPFVDPRPSLRWARCRRPLSGRRTLHLLSAHDGASSGPRRLVLQPHLWGGTSGCVVTASGAGLVAASPM